MENYHFVIITPGRSGSEHLSETLNNFPDVIMDGEIFNQNNMEPGSFNHFLRSAVSLRLIGFFFNRGKFSRSTFNYPLSILISLFFKRKSPAPACQKGFKLTLDQLNAYPFLLKYIKSQNIRIIFLHREDRLSMTLSLIRARKTGIYHSRSQASNIDQYFFDQEEVRKLYKQLENWEASLLRELAPEQYFKVSYEALWKNYEQVLRNLRAFLGLSIHVKPTFSSIKKGESRNLEDWVENIDELRAALVH